MLSKIVRVPNHILEELASSGLCGAESRIALVVVQETFGQCRAEAAISLNRFAQVTGTSRRNVVRTLNKLWGMRVLLKIPTLPAQTTIWAINQDTDKWLGREDRKSER